MLKMEVISDLVYKQRINIYIAGNPVAWAARTYIYTRFTASDIAVRNIDVAAKLLTFETRRFGNRSTEHAVVVPENAVFDFGTCGIRTI